MKDGSRILSLTYLLLLKQVSDMPVAHGKIFCQIYFIKRFIKQNFIKCTLLIEKFHKISGFIK